MFKTLTLASIYELQGFKEEALTIYEEILKKDPENFEAKQDLKTFERWLMQWN